MPSYDRCCFTGNSESGRRQGSLHGWDEWRDGHQCTRGGWNWIIRTAGVECYQPCQPRSRLMYSLSWAQDHRRAGRSETVRWKMVRNAVGIRFHGRMFGMPSFILKLRNS